MLGNLIDILSVISLIHHAFLYILDEFLFLIVPCRLPTDLKEIERRKNMQGKLLLFLYPKSWLLNIWIFWPGTLSIDLQAWK